MSDRTNMLVGLLSMAATLVVIPASVALALGSIRDRQAVAVLRTPTTFEIRDTDILDSTMYHTQREETGRPSGELRLVSVVVGAAEADAAIAVWDSVRAEPLIQRTGMNVHFSIVGNAPVSIIRPGVTVGRVKDLVAFATRTGIRVFPFTLIIAADDHILAAGPGLPDARFIREASQRFSHDGTRAATTFRPVTAEINATLQSVEMLLGPESSAQ